VLKNLKMTSQNDYFLRWRSRGKYDCISERGNHFESVCEINILLWSNRKWSTLMIDIKNRDSPLNIDIKKFSRVSTLMVDKNENMNGFCAQFWVQTNSMSTQIRQLDGTQKKGCHAYFSTQKKKSVSKYVAIFLSLSIFSTLSNFLTMFLKNLDSKKFCHNCPSPPPT